MQGRRAFYKLSFSTLVAVYLLILVGGIVRSTGSGMGCPDWPKCFGSWVPPASVTELPENYKEIYSDYRHKKNERFARYLVALGMDGTANKILRDESIRRESDFNVVKTWIEYANRIVGVIIGFLIFLVFVASIKFWNTRRSWTITAFLTFILVGFQGWIGSVVVSTNLTPWVITVHMFLALIIVALLIYLVFKADESWPGVDAYKLNWWLVGCMIILAVQILLGTQVRETMDLVASEISGRENWIAALGMPFLIHRSFSLIVLLFHTVLILKLRKSGVENRFTLSLILLILGTIFTGIGMAWFGVPPFLQPIHLLLATVTFGVQFLLLLRINTKEIVHVTI